jgi:Zn-finger nucleic acid-binding protein
MEAASAGMLCPVCRVDLVMTDRQGVEIDYCPKCRGVWLDRGELDKVIERSADSGEASAGYVPRHPRDHDDHYYERDRHYDPRYGRRRKKSFLSEIFDFD